VSDPCLVWRLGSPLNHLSRDAVSEGQSLTKAAQGRPLARYAAFCPVMLLATWAQ